ncbi:unnamed protein product, partial [Didymodactylos carnosus]
VVNDQNDSTAGEQEGEKKSESNHAPLASTKQIIFIRADQLLNLTITKTGLDLAQRLSALFNDVYNRRLPPGEDEEKPLLSMQNATGKELVLYNLDGIEFVDRNTSCILKDKDSIALTVPTTGNDRTASTRLSVIEEQDYHRRQELSVKVR